MKSNALIISPVLVFALLVGCGHTRERMKLNYQIALSSAMIGFNMARNGYNAGDVTNQIQAVFFKEEEKK